MPTSVGPNTYGEENLVFGYDLGDVSNSYKGEPAYNRHNYDKSVMSQTGFDAWGCYDGNNTPYHTWGISQTKALVNLPGPDGKDTNAMLYHNITGGGFGPTDWGTGVPAAIITAGNKITLQGWVKAADAASVGKTVTPYIYVYVNGGGAQATATNFTLTANWQLVSTTMTVNADGNNSNGFVYFFTGGGSNIRMYLTKTAVLSGIDHAVQWLPGGQTRSATQGLIDLTGNSTIDLANVSFDSNAQMTFDGTNDYVNIDTVPSAIANLDQGTIEIVFKWEGSGGMATLFYIGDISEPALEGQFYIWVGDTTGASSTEGIRILFRNASNQTLWDKYEAINSSTYFRDGEYHHLVVTQNGSAPKIYIDNVDITSNLINWTTPTNEGAFFSAVNCTRMLIGNQYYGGTITGSTPLDGDIPYVKIYSRALTASEVASNFKAIKGRFNI